MYRNKGMPLRNTLFIVLALTLAGCRQTSTAGPGPSCDIPHWRREQPDPPGHVLIWKVKADPGIIGLNGRALQEQDALRLIGKSRLYRPSPYLILEPEIKRECRTVEALARRIDQVFDCSRNYCYYPDAKVESKLVKVQP